MFPIFWGEQFEFDAFEGARINSGELSLKEFFYIKGDVEGFQDMGEQVRAGQGKISSQVADFGHVLKDKFCKFNIISCIM